jgi:hypothetical protein
MWFTIGFTVACAMGVWVLPANGLVVSILIFSVLTFLGRKRGIPPLSMAMLGCTLGLCWYLGFLHLNLIPAHAMDGTTVETTTVMTAMVTAAEASVRTAAKVMSTAVESSAVMTASCHFYYPLRFSIPYDIR